MRLGKYLAHAGVASRRAAEQLVFAGRVTWAARWSATRRATWGRATTSRSTAAASALEHQPRRATRSTSPRAYVSTAKDPQGRPTVVEARPEPRAALPGGPARHGHDGADPADERRRAGPPADPPVVRGPAGLSCTGAQCAGAGAGAAQAARGGRARRRRHRAGRRAAAVGRARRARAARGPQAPGAADARGGRPPGRALERVAFGPLRLGDLPLGAHRQLKARRGGGAAQASRRAEPAQDGPRRPTGRRPR